MRVLFTVALTVVVLAVAMPAIEFVGVERSETTTRAAVDGLVDAARTMASANDALANEAAAARRTVAMDLPHGGFASAPLVSLEIGPPESTPARSESGRTRQGDGEPVATTRITWRVAGGSRHVRQVDGLRLRPVAGEEFAVRRATDLRLVVTLVERDGLRVVTVARLATDGPAR